MVVLAPEKPIRLENGEQQLMGSTGPSDAQGEGGHVRGASHSANYITTTSDACFQKESV